MIWSGLLQRLDRFYEVIGLSKNNWTGDFMEKIMKSIQAIDLLQFNIEIGLSFYPISFLARTHHDRMLIQQ